MDFGLSDEQRLFTDALRGWLGENVTIDRVRSIMESERGFDAGIVKGLAAQGVTGIVVPESHGGAGLGILDAAIAAIELGRAVAPVSFHSACVGAPLALTMSNAAALKDRWLPAASAGTAVLSFAETASSPRGGTLTGRSLFVPDAGVADAFVVITGEGAGREAWLVERDAPGLTIEMLATVDDSRRVGELSFEAVALGSRHQLAGVTGRSIDRIVDAIRIVLAADAFGAAERALESAVAYSLDRKQFRRVVGSFQGVKHMCAEAYAEIEPLRAFLWYAAFAWDENQDDSPRVAALLKAHAAETTTAAVTTAVQVFGGMGFTWECDAHLWFKRAGYDRQMFGAPSELRARACSRSISSST